MKSRKIIGLAASSMALALVVGACGGGSSPTPSAATGEKPYIAIVSKGSQHQFWQAVQKGATDEAAALGATITYEGPASESEVDKQLTMLQTALDKNPAAICFAALDSKAATPYLEQAKEKGIPVVGFDSGVDSEIPVTTVTTDNLAAAGEAADQMAKLIGDAARSRSSSTTRPPRRARTGATASRPGWKRSIPTSRSSRSSTAPATP